MKKYILIILILFTTNQIIAQCSYHGDYTYTVDSNDTLSITLTSNVLYQISSWTWDFGDGTPLVRGRDPVHHYEKPGIYIVTLFGFFVDSTGVHTLNCTDRDTIIVNKDCSAYFSYHNNNNGRIEFQSNSLSKDSVNLVSWDFGDSSIVSNQKKPIHSYDSSGTYLVSLAIYDSLNNCSDTISDSISVNLDSNFNCVAKFKTEKDTNMNFNVILFNESSDSSSHMYEWNFGDNSPTDSLRNPTHTYQQYGVYEVCLTINDTVLNCRSTYCDTIGMDTLGNLKTAFSIEVRNPLTVGNSEELERKSNSLNLYPNPTTGYIYFKNLLSYPKGLTITIFNSSGKMVLSKYYDENENFQFIDISNFEKGFYIMNLKFQNENITRKIIKMY